MYMTMWETLCFHLGTTKSWADSYSWPFLSSSHLNSMVTSEAWSDSFKRALLCLFLALSLRGEAKGEFPDLQSRDFVWTRSGKWDFHYVETPISEGLKNVEIGENMPWCCWRCLEKHFLSTLRYVQREGGGENIFRLQASIWTPKSFFNLGLKKGGGHDT